MSVIIYMHKIRAQRQNAPFNMSHRENIQLSPNVVAELRTKLQTDKNVEIVGGITVGKPANENTPAIELPPVVSNPSPVAQQSDTSPIVQSSDTSPVVTPSFTPAPSPTQPVIKSKCSKSVIDNSDIMGIWEIKNNDHVYYDTECKIIEENLLNAKETARFTITTDISKGIKFFDYKIIC